MKTLNKYIVVISVLLTSVFSGLIKGQELDYIKEITQYGDSLFLISYTDYEGNLIAEYESMTFPTSMGSIKSGIGGTDDIGSDFLEATMYLPDNSKGVRPYDICYNPNYNKIYIYGNQKLLIFDATTKELIRSIKVSSFGDQGVNVIQHLPRIKCLAYDTDHDKLYCATLGRELKVIDGNTNIVEKEYDMYYKTYQRTPILMWNQSANRIYWINNFLYGGPEIKVIDANDQTILYTYSWDTGTIHDLEINSNSGLCYTSFTGVNGLQFVNAENFLQGLIVNTGTVDEIIYNPVSNKIYGHPWDENWLIKVDGTSGYIYPETISIPSDKVNNSCYNSNDNKIYFTCGIGNMLNYFVIGIDGSNENIVLNSQVNGAWSLLYVNSNDQNKVICGGKNIIKIFDGTSNQLFSEVHNNNCISRKLVYIQSEDEVITINELEHTMTFLDLYGTFLGTTDLGGCTFLGCYNSIDNKVYFSQYGIHYNNSFVNIYNSSNNNKINSCLIGANILGICFNELNNRIFVSSYDNNYIKVIRGQYDDIINTINVNQPNQLFSYKNKIYCGTPTELVLIDADDYEQTTISNFGGGFYWAMACDEENDRVFLINTSHNKIYALDYNSNIANVIDLPANSKPFDIVYNNQNNKIYTSNLITNTISVINGYNYHWITDVTVPGSLLSLQLEYGTFTNKIYLCSKKVINGNTCYFVRSIDGITNSLDNDFNISLNGMPSELKYNSINNTLYVHKHLSFENPNLEMVIIGIDCSIGNIVQNIGTGNYQIPFYDFLFPYNYERQNMLLNNEKNKLFTGNFGFANISAVKISEDKVGLKGGYNWISFPRMPRYAFHDEPYSSVSVLENISWYPNEDFYLENQAGWQKNWEDPYWYGNLDLVQSTLGYKLNLDPADLPEPYITLKGARLYPECPIGLPDNGQEKWIGYFIEESQYPWQAFPADVYNSTLTKIQAQYWSMVKNASQTGWKISGKVTPIKYGDMVVIKTNLINNPNMTFTWSDTDDSEEDVEIAMPQSYTWEEKANYVPFFIETDSTSDIAEIAVKVDGVCMGATVRHPGDTLMEVDGYIMDLPAGSVVEFETWNGYKSTPVVKDGYVVYNQFTRKKEKRNIYVGEHQEYYDVSFKSGEVFEIPDDVSHVTCQPNPFTNETTITMRLNIGLRIWVEVYEIGGAKVKTLLDGDLPGGYYEAKWYGDNEQGGKVSRGIYFYKIRTGSGTEISEKIVLID